MDPFEFGRRLNARAARTAAIPMLGLGVGLLAGAGCAYVLGADAFGTVRIVAKAGLAGSFLGLGAAFAAATGSFASLSTVRGLAWLIVIAAVLVFFWAAIP
ncbi:hypothetical protein [Paludisphaera soli]|uniref:hypothetical protein n=1 Tax=Paludisphaera soli TaxID=2712865 RepID=UPI0013ED063A|nr:hypothetical protein [Paludisphaera soli]